MDLDDFREPENLYQEKDQKVEFWRDEEEEEEEKQTMYTIHQDNRC